MCDLDALNRMYDYLTTHGSLYYKAHIYSFNEQGRHLFESLRFCQTDEEWYECHLQYNRLKKIIF